MASAAPLIAEFAALSWRVVRDGKIVAQVDVRHEGGQTVVSTELEGRPSPVPNRFDTLQAANAFAEDLLTSFAYLGCAVSPA